jgi:5'-nucleotidase / UDP-sugar diphosphatase
MIPVRGIAPDPEIAGLVKRHTDRLDGELLVEIGTATRPLDSRRLVVREGEAAIGNLFADAMRSSVKADAAVTNGGGIRAGKVYAAGSAITRRDILAELPFNNRVVEIEISGGDLRRALENGLAQLPGAGGRFPQVSGLTIEVDLKRAAGDRIVAISVGGAPLDNARIYKVAINDFLARGGDGYVWFRDAKHVLPEGDSPLLANAVMAHVKRLGTVRNAVEGRILQR